MEKKREVSTKNTKNEILEAYNELLAKVGEQKPVERKVEKKREEEKVIVKDASEHSVENIIKGLTDIKLEVGKALDSLEEKFITKYKNFTDLQEAIDIETKRLEEIYEIKVNTDSLAALLLAQSEKKKAFEIEMAEKKEQWNKEQQTTELTKKEREEETKKERKREEEEYNYSLQMKRKKDTDAYEAKKAVLEKELVEKKAAVEKELSEREAILSSREKEFEELKTQADTFPKQLEKAVKETEKAVTENLELKYKHEMELAAKDIEGERKLNKQIIVALEAKIKEQDARIRELTQKTNEAGQQVQNIAVKALEGASSQRASFMNYEKKHNEASRNQ